MIKFIYFSKKYLDIFLGLYKMMTNDDIFTSKSVFYIRCELCDFKCCKTGDWNRHILTRKHQKKHKMMTNDDKMMTKEVKNEKNTSNHNYMCQCGKGYKYRQGLSVHKKVCQIKEKEKENINNKDLSDKEIIKMLIKENSDFKNMIIDVVKTIQPNNTINNTTNNNTTNNFNLQFFLNDTCKDAISLVDFVESLQVKLKDLEETARVGYTEGVSKIFINGLNKLDVTMRPIHCSDAKRETLYIKDHDEWTKEDLNKSHLTKAIKTVTNKNIQQIFEWQKKYPEYNDPDSKQSDKYMEMICNTMSGSSSEEQEKNMNKIIKNITKEVVIDKLIK
jgi:hypothetical protein